MRQLKIQNQITVREGPALEKYLQEISKHNPLTAEQEVECAVLIRVGDEAALEKLITANLRFVVSVAKQYQNQGLSLSDLINEGNLGLLKAAKRFDETKGFKFISYAVWWIRQSIMQSLVEHSRMIRLPLNKVDSYKKINHALTRFLQENQREPNALELSEITDMSVKDVKNILKLTTKHVSMDAPLGMDDNNTPMISVLQNDQLEQPDENLMGESLKNEIENILSVLNQRESDILSCYFGLKEDRHMSLEDIGARFGLTRERVRQIKERAIRRLRKASMSNELKGYLG
ncbi:UNVERIFIED_CONTAM: hypothetical protein GTU68_042848 [Idotea baltica]|nr:hypothetical protein [Idotea baltica]